MRLCPGMASVVSRRRTRMPPWLSVTMRAHDRPPCHRCFASWITLLASAASIWWPSRAAAPCVAEIMSPSHSPVWACTRCAMATSASRAAVGRGAPPGCRLWACHGARAISSSLTTTSAPQLRWYACQLAPSHPSPSGARRSSSSACALGARPPAAPPSVVCRGLLMAMTTSPAANARLLRGRSSWPWIWTSSLPAALSSWTVQSPRPALRRTVPVSPCFQALQRVCVPGGVSCCRRTVSRGHTISASAAVEASLPGGRSRAYVSPLCSRRWSPTACRRVWRVYLSSFPPASRMLSRTAASSNLASAFSCMSAVASSTYRAIAYTSTSSIPAPSRIVHPDSSMIRVAHSIPFPAASPHGWALLCSSFAGSGARPGCDDGCPCDRAGARPATAPAVPLRSVGTAPAASPAWPALAVGAMPSQRAAAWRPSARASSGRLSAARGWMSVGIRASVMGRCTGSSALKWLGSSSTQMGCSLWLRSWSASGMES